MFKSFIISYKTNKKSHSEEQLNSRNRMKSHNHPEYIIAQKSAPVRRGTLRNEFMKKFIIGNCIIDSVA